MEVTGFGIVKVETLTDMYCRGVFDVVMKSLLYYGLLKLGIVDEGKGVFFFVVNVMAGNVIRLYPLPPLLVYLIL